MGNFFLGCSSDPCALKKGHKMKSVKNWLQQTAFSGPNRFPLYYFFILLLAFFLFSLFLSFFLHLIQSAIAISWSHNVNVQHEQMKVYRLVNHPKERGQKKRWGGWFLFLRNSSSAYDVRVFFIFHLRANIKSLLYCCSFFSMTLAHILIAPLVITMWMCAETHEWDIISDSIGIKVCFSSSFFPLCEQLIPIVWALVCITLM